ncbi:glycosyltransferase family 2 protein [Seleniivibrio sp.]|uniref:glycosyltransferase family 2 protein n=1 Tax=Seleniivibrio sp. TaxID=2898801 RepID=UPI0025CC6F64|nr:glycosyltransferase family 2 protein [Seleniivibrio sp.]MCD8554276.1 glycosyltransferase [Seleniivibrio sp.]
MNRTASVVMTTYNRADMLMSAVSAVLGQTYTDIELVISDDCSTDTTEGVIRSINDPRVRYVRTEKNSGYTLNSLNGIRHASGAYIIFVSDDDRICDERFIEDAVALIEKGADMVFSRVRLKTEYGDIVNNHPFKASCTPAEFIQSLLDIRLNHPEHFCFSNFLFKRDMLMQTAPFVSMFKDSIAADIATIIKYAADCEKIAFLDRVTYEWTRNSEESFSHSGKANLIKQTELNLSAPLDMHKYFKDKNLSAPLRAVINTYLDRRTEYTFLAILADRDACSNEQNFRRALAQITDGQTAYICFKGWVGLALHEYMEKADVRFGGFIDDFKKDAMSFEQFAKTAEKPCSVIIAGYKHKDVLRAYKKLWKIPNIKIIDILQEEQ